MLHYNYSLLILKIFTHNVYTVNKNFLEIKRDVKNPNK
jgi:hypothetical protein